ncbi:MAG: methylenetetrahydrofolate--tRNA-(uracil(54)-C(5))-methyltransferase (FADH(2)-oxidizing) TrmFO [Eubacteriales bacterium]|nr:methylenetetrahydrofolate--tRNA-(uracil(54)-C(5))-methyltransferase (FADH(2)-oxidizing) TrmFO [Eubacteriales bacterium]
MRKITIIGAGLAGCEAAWQVAKRGIPVVLIDMKPGQMSEAHHNPNLAELVCSNSLRANRLENAVGLLKEEMRRLDSLILACADATAIPAGGALAVDRDLFAQCVTDRVKNHPLIEFRSERVDVVPEQLDAPLIIASGPLTDGTLFDSIRDRLKLATLHFFDAAAPIVTIDSIDLSIAFRQSRYGRGGDDYINCPMNEAEYQAFYTELVAAELAEVKDFDREIVFEGCMPVESMAKRGVDTIRFGPLKPVGLVDPRTGAEPYACVQLRQDNQAASLYNLVGFQTRLKIGEQKRVFSMIPGLQQAEFVRFGVMHRNTYLPSPEMLDPTYRVRRDEPIYFAGQMTGVEGYIESASSGLLAGIQAALEYQDLPIPARLAVLPTRETVIGSLAHYIASAENKHFQPMNANFGLIAPLVGKFRKKTDRQQAVIERALLEIDQVVGKLL